jgi:hypothetical protein
MKNFHCSFLLSLLVLIPLVRGASLYFAVPVLVLFLMGWLECEIHRQRKGWQGLLGKNGIEIPRYFFNGMLLLIAAGVLFQFRKELMRAAGNKDGLAQMCMMLIVALVTTYAITGFGRKEMIKK